MNDDRQLIQSVLAGEKNAFSTLIDRYKKLVGHIVFKIVKSEEDRQDIVQDVFVKVYQNLGNFNGDCKLSSWIGRIAYNTSLNHIGKKREELWQDISPDSSMETVLDDSERPDEAAARNDLTVMLQDEISHLKPPYDVILSLFHLDELSYQEIANVTGMPEGTVKSYLFRARRELKDRLLKRYPVEEWMS